MKALITLLLLIPLFASAQQITTLDNIPYIEVIGIAEKEITPNIITFKISLQENNDKNKINIEEQERKLIAQLKEEKLDFNKLLIDNSNIHTSKLKRISTTNRKDYFISVSNSEDAYKVHKVLNNLNVSEASITELSHTDIQIYKKDLQKVALQSAKEKATNLLTAIGETIDKPLIIREEANNIVAKNIHSNILIKDLKSDENEDELLNIKPIILKMSMYARFKIKQ